MQSSRHNAIAIMGLMAAAGMAGIGGNVSVLRQEDTHSGYRMGRRSQPRPDQGGYPGAKLAKKARKGQLTICRIR
jgi:hypothetical protein